MAYEDSAALALDLDFAGRLGACLSDESKGKGDNVSTVVLRNPGAGVRMFMPFISTAPGFGEAYANGGQSAIDDGMLLSAVQANWDAVVALYPATP